MYALNNCSLFNGEFFEENKAIVIDGERIHSVVNCEDIGSIDSVDLDGALCVPGFIDLQVNGGGGLLFNDSPTKSAIDEIYKSHRRFGTTSICPTFITDSCEKLKSAIGAVSACDSEKIPAVHIEGFSISREKSGIHDKRFIRKFTQEDARGILNAASCKKIITLAPEETPADVVRLLKDGGAVVFGGHSNASYESFTEFLENGGIGATHLYNAMSGMTSRAPGVCGAVLDSCSAYAGIIADGHHVHFACVRIAKRLMGERLFLVTDAMPPACSDIEEYVLYGNHITVKSGVCVSDDGVIAGSCLSMAEAVNNCVKHCEIPLFEALRMASLYPARILSRENNLGRIAHGYFADISILSGELAPIGTVVKGDLMRA